MRLVLPRMFLTRLQILGLRAIRQLDNVAVGVRTEVQCWSIAAHGIARILHLVLGGHAGMGVADARRDASRQALGSREMKSDVMCASVRGGAGGLMAARPWKSVKLKGGMWRSSSASSSDAPSGRAEKAGGRSEQLAVRFGSVPVRSRSTRRSTLDARLAHSTPAAACSGCLPRRLCYRSH